MSPISGLFFLLPLTLSLSLTTAVATNQTNATSLISKACSRSLHADFCLSLLNSDPNSKYADLKGLAFIALKAASKNATATVATIKALLNDTSDAGPTVDDGLRSCDQVYGDVVDQIEDSIDSMVSGAYNDVGTWMKAAIADIETCENSLQGQKGDALEVSQKNRILRQMCNTALGIVHVLADN
ncbi:Pectinesterase [Actinidia chinensis var. chinensis]|uniref:Pectinesterase n=1 Tax=Actinidia chinensis var. chinensis TaxID=1590841 RepID=A0A2R6PDR9_ACTCC|nr:Pectinesterase [Actinidia chinensis var. chinensis]